MTSLKEQCIAPEIVMVATGPVEREFRKANQRTEIDARWTDEGIERVAMLLKDVRLNGTRLEFWKRRCWQALNRRVYFELKRVSWENLGEVTSLWHATDYFRFIDSIWYVGMIIIGGLGSTLGSILGVVFIKLLDELVTVGAPALAGLLPTVSGLTAATASMAAFGVVVMLFLIFEPRGLTHRWEVFKLSYRLWPFSYWPFA